MFYLKWIWEKLKKYWKYLAALVGGILLFFLVHDKPKNDIVKILKNQLNDNEKQVIQIQESHKEELEKNREIEQESQKKLEKLDVDFGKQKEKLHEKHVEEVKQLAEEYKDKPDEMAKKLADKYGIEYVP